jgi:hypothetical protein
MSDQLTPKAIELAIAREHLAKCFRAFMQFPTPSMATGLKQCRARVLYLQRKPRAAKIASLVTQSGDQVSK